MLTRRRSLIAATAIAAFAATTQSAVAYEPRFNWIGSAVITGVTPECAGKWDVGIRLYSVFRPRLQSSEDNSAISFEGYGPAGIFQTTDGSQMQGAGNYVSQSFGFSHTRPTQSASTYDFTISPGVIKKTTLFVQITGTISDFFANTGCNIQFRGAYTLKP